MVTEEVKNLIADARNYDILDHMTPGELFGLAGKLADALEASEAEVLRQRDINRRAELQYQELEAECVTERERADSIQAALDGFRGVARGDNEYLIGRVEKAEAQRDALRTQLDAVEALRLKWNGDPSYPITKAAAGAQLNAILSRAIDTKEKP